MSDESTPYNQTRNGDNTRARILQAARALFGTLGFDGTSVRQIAGEVGITDAALYYHFKSKKEILAAIWEQPGRGPMSRMRPDGPLSPQTLGEIVVSSVDFSIANESFLRLMSREILRGDRTALALRNRNRAVVLRTLTEHFRTVMAPEEAELRAASVHAFVTGMNLRTRLAAGARFAEAASDPEYRTTIVRRANAMARLDERGSA